MKRIAGETTFLAYADRLDARSIAGALAQVEFPGVDTLFLARIIGLDPDEASLDWIGMKVKGRFRRLSKFKPTDVYFYPA
jgi:uncharacterized OB-fold protein